ncbi:30S ribosomal protein S3 [Candidatus Woesearchaeota archaeon]|nr:30S ribosomal protein S3 [Candidatus Woesearchaeota archaeon]MBW3006069.1 30S ribosomal protein S3 [Candidatus Woesearchaeota archaeon]
MIERKLLKSKMKEFQVEDYIAKTLQNAGHSHTKLVRTPLGEKIIIFASRPGIVVGRKGENIKKLTNTLKRKFKFENPQIEISEVENPNLDAQIVAEKIASTLERFGLKRFKATGHKTLSDVMSAGAIGIEIVMSGKIPSTRARSWRFYSGYLKKCGDIALTGVKTAYASAQLKSGTVGIRVKIMPPDVKLPDDIEITEEPTQEVEEVKEK